MLDKVSSYISTWWMIMARPVLFFTNVPEGDWREDPLTFAGITSWVLAFVISVVVFIVQQVPIGMRLVEGATARQMLFASPVLLVFSLAFFAMTFLIAGGVVLAGVLMMLSACAMTLHGALRLLGGKGSLKGMLKAALYCSGALLFAVIPVIFAIFAKYKLVEMWQLAAIENIVYYTACLYIWGLFSIAGRKVHDVPRWKAFLAASVLLVGFILVGIIFHSKVFPKFEKFLI
jgi:hypothetical protein